MTTLDFSPRVFLCRTSSYILVRKGNKYGHFLTMASGSIELVKVPIDGPGYVVQKRNEGEAAKESALVSYPLTPYHKVSLESALRTYQGTTLKISVRAKAALDQLLGVSSPPAQDKTIRRPVEPLGGGYTLRDLCNELRLDPGKVRAELRRRRAEKPGGKWEWSSKEAAMEAVKNLIKSEM